MKIHEYQGKEILREFGVPTPRGTACFSVDEAVAAAQALGGNIWVVKAQIHAGGRGKGGGVKLAKSPAEAKQLASQILGMTLVTHQTGPQGKLVRSVYVEAGSEIARELYLALTLDRATENFAVIASTEGGMDIEHVAETTPEKIHTEFIDPVVGLQPYQCRKIARALKLDAPQTKKLEGYRDNALRRCTITDLGAGGVKLGETAIREGFDYARAGQTRALTVEPGRLIAGVQGRAIRAYRLTIQVETFTEEQWERAVSALADQAIFSARLLAGEMPPEIESIFQAQGLSLFPRGPQDLALVCSAPNEIPWCKHVCCVALLLAEALEREPFSLFALRGLAGSDLLDRLRRRRSERTAAAAEEAASAPDAVAEAGRSLEDDLERFWEAGPGLETVETAPKPPEVGHALLRRLGPSPFPAGSFPIVGLLATCYDAISKAAVEGDPPGPGEGSSAVEPSH